jgi:hypothetical protein
MPLAALHLEEATASAAALTAEAAITADATQFAADATVTHDARKVDSDLAESTWWGGAR